MSVDARELIARYSNLRGVVSETDKTLAAATALLAEKESRLKAAEAKAIEKYGTADVAAISQLQNTEALKLAETVSQLQSVLAEAGMV